MLVTAGDHGKLYIYNIARDAIQAGPMLAPLGDPKSDRDLVQRFFCKLSPDNQRLAVWAEGDSVVSLWDLQTGESIGEPLRATGRVNAIEFSPSGKTLAIAADHIILHNAISGDAMPLTITSVSKASDIAFSPDGELLASIYEDRTVRLWQTSTGKPSGRPLLHSESPFGLAFAAGGELLLTHTRGGGHLWDYVSGTEVGPILPDTREFKVSPDGRTIAGARGKEILLWEVPKPVADDASAYMRRIEAATGLRLDEERMIQPLTLEEWQSRRDSRSPIP